MDDKAVEYQAHEDEVLGEVAEEFTQRLRQGEQPAVGEYVRRYPEFAETIRQILPTLELMSEAPYLKPVEELTGEHSQLGTLGEYQLIREVGRGGMGVVYEADQPSLGRRVALKVLPFAAVLDERQVKRFRAEALAAAQLDHPHIVDVYGVGCERSVHFYSMRFVDGPPLSQVIHQMVLSKSGDSDSIDASSDRAPLTGKGLESFLNITRIGIESAEALDHAHKQGVIHRDIKPGNIILDSNGKSWIADFGLARIVTDVTMTLTGNMVGTVRYMSPEQALAKREIVDHRSDIYSLGITLYEFLTLQPAFPDEDPHQLLRKIAHEEPKLPRKLNPEIPVELETIVLKAIAKNPSERYETAQELADDLKRFVHGEPIVARRISHPERAWRWCKRNPMVAGLTSTVGLVLVAGIYVSLMFAFSESAARERETGAKKQAQQQKLTAEESARVAKDRLVQLMDANGIDSMDQGDLSGAMLWFAHAIGEGSEASPAALARLQGLMDTCWMPVQVSDGAYCTPDGRTVLSYHRPAHAQELVYQERAERADYKAERYVIVRDANTGQKIAEIPLGEMKNHGIYGFSPDDRWVVSGSETDLSFRVWDLQSGTPVSPLLRHAEPLVNLASVVTIDFSSDGRYLATSASRKTVVWETRTWEQACTITNSTIDAQFGPGSDLLVRMDEGLQVWDVQAKKALTKPFGDRVGVARLSPDGTRIVAEREFRTTGEPSLRVWDAKSGTLLAHAHTDGKTYDRMIWSHASLAISPDGRYFTSVEFPDRAIIWSMEDASMVVGPMRHEGRINSVEFSPRSDRIVTASVDGTAKVWDLDGKELATFQHDAEVRSARFTPNGQQVITYGTGIRVWKLPDAILPGRNVADVPMVEQAADEVSDEEQCEIEIKAQLNKVIALDAPPLPRNEDGVLMLVGNPFEETSPDRRWLAKCSGQVVEFWDRVHLKKIPVSVPCDGSPGYVRFSRDSKLVAVCGKGFEVWNTQTWTKVCENKRLTPVFDLEFLGDEVAVVTPNQLSFVDLETGEIAGRPFHVGTGCGWNGMMHIRRLIASDEKGERIAAACLTEVAIVVDRASKKRTMPPIVHFDDINHIALSPDGRFLVTASDDRTARLWDLETGEEHCPPLRHNAAVNYAGFSRDGHFVFTKSNGKTGRIWDTATGQPAGVSFQTNLYVAEDCRIRNGKSETFTYFTDEGWRFMIPEPSFPVEHVVEIAEVYSGRKLTKTGYLAPLPKEELAARIRSLRKQEPEMFQ